MVRKLQVSTLVVSCPRSMPQAHAPPARLRSAIYCASLPRYTLFNTNADPLRATVQGMLKVTLEGGSQGELYAFYDEI